MRRVRWAAVVWLSATLLAACATGPRWQLVHPPESADPGAPGGRRLEPGAAVATWRPVDDYPNRRACDDARNHAWHVALERAHATRGADAKYDLDVRRAVHARCVSLR